MNLPLHLIDGSGDKVDTDKEAAVQLDCDRSPWARRISRLEKCCTMQVRLCMACVCVILFMLERILTYMTKALTDLEEHDKSFVLDLFNRKAPYDVHNRTIRDLFFQGK